MSFRQLALKAINSKVAKGTANGVIATAAFRSVTRVRSPFVLSIVFIVGVVACADCGVHKQEVS